MTQVVPMHGADASWSRERAAFLQGASDDPVIQVPYSRRYQLLLLVALLFAAAPVIFGFVRAINTGDDFRYLWLAAAAILGSAVVMVPGYSRFGCRAGLSRACGGRRRRRSRVCRRGRHFTGSDSGSGSCDSRSRARALHWKKRGASDPRAPTAGAVTRSVPASLGGLIMSLAPAIGMNSPVHVEPKWVANSRCT